MKTNFKFLLIVLLQLIMINGCEKNTNQVAIAQNDVLIPLKMGNTWIYKNTQYDTLNNVRDIYYDTVTVVNDSILFGETWFITNNLYSFKSAGWGISQKLKFNSDPLYLLPDSKAINIYKFPCNLNDQYFVDTAQFYYYSPSKLDTVKSKYTINSISTNITVPAGTFNCIYYKPDFYFMNDSISNINNFTTPHTWIAVNIGIVKCEFKNYLKSNEKLIRELIYYDLK